MISNYGAYKRYKQVFGVTSHSNQDKEYVVALSEKGEWSCSCPAWIYRSPRKPCKHITEAMKSQVMQSAVSKSITPKAEAALVKVEKALSRFAVIEV
jgi:hypothetical protein